MQTSLPETMLPEIIPEAWQEKDHEEGKAELTATRLSLHVTWGAYVELGTAALSWAE